MADLGYSINDPTGTDCTFESQEVVLCRITVDNNGCLIMQPDFTRGEALYVVENPTNKGMLISIILQYSLVMMVYDLENFEYSIKNVSTTTPSAEKEKEIKLLKEVS